MTDYTLLKGVDKLYYAKITQDDAAAYAAGAPVALAPIKLAVQTPKTGSKTEYFDNDPMFNFLSEGETKIKLDITMLPLDVQADILGKVYDVTNESLYDNGGTPPDCALGFRAKNSDGTYTYLWYYKGNFGAPEETANTETDSIEPKGLSLEFTAIRTKHQFALDGSVTASVKRRVSRKQADGATWFDAVQVPEVGTPDALTCTPVPADAAVGVVVSSNITLTFNNALRSHAEDGIVLTTAAGVVKACARTIDAARKVVTLNPTTDMGAATDYLIIVPGVVDIYGQALADTVVNFTTA